MPLYEYTCTQCEREFELLVRNGEPVACPHCGGSELEKLLSAPAAHTAASSQLPLAGETCGRPQCQRGCQFS